MKEAIKAAIDAAVDVVSDKSESVKQDIKTHMFRSTLAGEQVENIAEQIVKMIQDLGSQFENMGLDQSILAGYLFENLDLPRNNIQLNDINDLIYVGNEANAANGETVIVPSKRGLSTLPDNGIAVKHEDDDKEKPIVKTVALVKLSATKAILFVLTKGIESYSLAAAKENLVVEKLENFAQQDFGRMLEDIKDTKYAPPLMMDREAIDITDLDSAWLNSFARDTDGLFDNLDDMNERALVDTAVRHYVDTNKIDVSSKRINLENQDELLQTAHQILNEERQKQQHNVEESLANGESIEDVEVIEELPEAASTVAPTTTNDETQDESLFSEGVTGQTEKTVTPEENIFAEEDVTVSDKSTAELAIDIFVGLGKNPEQGLSIIRNTNLTIKEALYREVVNTLPTLEKRTSDSYTDKEKENIYAHLDTVCQSVLVDIEKHRVAIENKRIENLPFKQDVVLETIKSSPVHSKFLNTPDKQLALAEKITQYLNDNDNGEGGDPIKHVKYMLQNLSLYGYETEAIINPAYRTTNVPNQNSLIRNTPVISTTLRSLYKTVKGWGEQEVDKLSKTFDDVFNGDLSALDLDKDTVGIIINGTVKPKEFTRVGGFVLCSVPVVAEDTTYTVVMSSAKAVVLVIDDTKKEVVAVSDIDKASLRLDLLMLLMYE